MMLHKHRAYLQLLLYIYSWVQKCLHCNIFYFPITDDNVSLVIWVKS